MWLLDPTAYFALVGKCSSLKDSKLSRACPLEPGETQALEVKENMKVRHRARGVFSKTGAMPSTRAHCGRACCVLCVPTRTGALQKPVRLASIGPDRCGVFLLVCNASA